MQITPNTEPKQENYYEFKDVYIIPSKGYKVNEPYIDFESGLLIIDESNPKEAKKSFGNWMAIPTIEHKLDPTTYKILTFEEWSQYFNYDKQEIISDDGKYKLITQRVYEKQRNSDGIEEKLIDLTTNKKIASSSRVAFYDEKWDNLLKRHYKEQKEIEERKQQIEAMPTLDEFLAQELAKLKDEQLIINYHNDTNSFKLIYSEGVFKLFQADGVFNDDATINMIGHELKSQDKENYDPNRVFDWWDIHDYPNYDELYDKYKKQCFDNLHYKIIQVFDTIEQFAEKYLTSKQWFVEHKKYEKEDNQVLKKFVVEFGNLIRQNHDFTFEEYEKFDDWEYSYFKSDSVKPSEYKQYCYRCKASVQYYTEYPKYVCMTCHKKAIRTNKELRGMFGTLCFIDNERFLEVEDRFGGTFIQPESWYIDKFEYENYGEYIEFGYFEK